MTLSEMRSRVRRLLNQESTTNTHFSDIEIDDAINDECIDVASETEILETYATFSTVASQEDYGAPSDLLKLKKMTVTVSSSDIRILDIVSHSDYLTESLPDPTVEGVPRVVRVQVGSVSLTDTTPAFYFLYPVPDIVYTMTGYYIQTPTKMTDDSHETEIPVYAHKRIVFGAATILALKDPGISMQRTSSFQALVNQETRQILARKNKLSHGGRFRSKNRTYIRLR